MGVRAKIHRESAHATNIIATPTPTLAATKPTLAISATHSGEKRTPPMLAPLYAFASAPGARARTTARSPH
jgi:hypothetical protein